MSGKTFRPVSSKKEGELEPSVKKLKTEDKAKLRELVQMIHKLAVAKNGVLTVKGQRSCELKYFWNQFGYLVKEPTRKVAETLVNEICEKSIVSVITWNDALLIQDQVRQLLHLNLPAELLCVRTAAVILLGLVFETAGVEMDYDGCLASIKQMLSHKADALIMKVIEKFNETQTEGMLTALHLLF